MHLNTLRKAVLTTAIIDSSYCAVVNVKKTMKLSSKNMNIICSVVSCDVQHVSNK